MRRQQSGYMAVMLAAIISLALALSVGTIVAQLRKSGDLDRSTVADGPNPAQQKALLAAQRRLQSWYQQYAFSLDSNPGQPILSNVLTQAGVQLSGGAVADVSYQVTGNGIGYHVFAIWYPVPGVVGTGLNHVTGVFSPGTMSGVPYNTQYTLVSGYPIESLNVQQTRTNMYRISDLLVSYFDDQQAASANSSINTNWFRSSTCASNDVALPCYDTDTPVGLTVLKAMIGLSDSDMITAWYPNNVITVNNYSTATLPPYSVKINSILPWGTNLTVYALSN